jgi:hypothetical protein
MRHERPRISEGRNYGREMAGQFGLWFRLPRKSEGSFICRKSPTWDRRLYFPSEGRHAVDFFARKSDVSAAGIEPAILGTRPPKPLAVRRKLKRRYAGHTCIWTN